MFIEVRIILSFKTPYFMSLPQCLDFAFVFFLLFDYVVFIYMFYFMVSLCYYYYYRQFYTKVAMVFFKQKCLNFPSFVRR